MSLNRPGAPLTTAQATAPAAIVTQAVGCVQTPVTVFFGTAAQTAIAATLTQDDAALCQIAVTVPSTLAASDYSIGDLLNRDRKEWHEMPAKNISDRRRWAWSRVPHDFGFKSTKCPHLSILNAVMPDIRLTVAGVVT